MSPQFICLHREATRQEALARVERSLAPADVIAWIYVKDIDGRLRGGLPLADVVRADPELPVGDVAVFMPPTLRAAADVEEIARLMTDYDLTVVPVVSERDRMIGVVTVDDVLEVVLPRGWRRRFDVLGGE
jgi:Mg/Co/Ni transporter MgtE